jgi:molybdate transport system permease protein
MGDSLLGLNAADWRAVGLSALVSAGGVAVSLPVGLLLGWVLSRRSFPGKALVETVVNLPLVLPPVITGYLLLLLLGKRGWIGAWLWNAFGIEIAFTWGAAMIVVAVMGFPLLVRAIRLAFDGIDPRLYQAARTLGARRLDAFWTVSLPLARNGVLAGVVLAFARGLGEFGATLLFYGNPEAAPTLALRFFNDWESGAPTAHLWRLVVASVTLAFVALAAGEYLERKGRRRESA